MPVKPSRIFKFFAIVGSVAVFVFALVLAIDNQTTLAEAWTLATTKQPERYTTLYFLNTGSLPTYSPAKQPSRITFRLINHESRDTEYTYSATLRVGNTTTPLATETVKLASEGSIDVPITFVIPEPEATGFITVQLIGRPEHLTFRSRS